MLVAIELLFVTSVSVADAFLVVVAMMQRAGERQHARYLDHLALCRSEIHRAQLAREEKRRLTTKKLKDTSPRMRALHRQRVIEGAEMKLGRCLLGSGRLRNGGDETTAA